MVRILVVEDDMDLQFLYETALSRYGHEITSVDVTSDAITYLTTDQFDLVILDINLPDTPGLKVAEVVHDNANLRHIPIIVVSAVDQYRTQAQELGVKYFMVKPLALHELLAVVEEVLGE
jgi:DNA-binding response OmpR family regulator